MPNTLGMPRVKEYKDVKETKYIKESKYVNEIKDERITDFLNIKFINGIKRIIKLQGSWGGIKRTIILVGEHHGNEECYESENALIKREQIVNYVDFYRALFQFNSDLKTPNAKFIDFFIGSMEARY